MKKKTLCQKCRCKDCLEQKKWAKESIKHLVRWELFKLWMESVTPPSAKSLEALKKQGII